MRTINFLSNLWNSVKLIFNRSIRPSSVVAPGRVSGASLIPDNIEKPDYTPLTLKRFKKMKQIEVKSEQQIKNMKEAGALARHVLSLVRSRVQPGITTDHIDQIVHHEIISLGAYPSPLGYRKFPKSCCTSVNNVVCHGVPDDRELISGDVINVDISVFYKGCHGDTSDTFAVGRVDVAALRLLATTRECLHRAIKSCQPGVPFSDIGHVIESHASLNNFSVCKEYIGHGIGAYFHGPPNIWHVKTPQAEFRPMLPGMTFTIEPILIEGSNRIKTLSDGWTVVTRDGSRSAQAEHTLLITSDSCIILT